MRVRVYGDVEPGARGSDPRWNRDCGLGSGEGTFGQR